jgi:hypothetical protein
MRLVKLIAAGALLVLVGIAPASAQVQISLRDGLVTLVATNATVRQILTEWARVGQTKIVNVERIPGGPVTLQLTNVPESEALDLLLKSVTGYMAAPRPATAPTLSRYDRILVLPTAAVARVPVAAAAPPVFQQPNAVQRPQAPPEDEESPSFQAPRGPLFPTFQQAQPGIPFPQFPQSVEEQVNFPAQSIPVPSGMPPSGTQPSVAAPFPGASAVGTPRPGMVIQPPPQTGPGPGPGFVIPQPQPTPDN